jgi:hypothetical protein
MPRVWVNLGIAAAYPSPVLYLFPRQLQTRVQLRSQRLIHILVLNPNTLPIDINTRIIIKADTPFRTMKMLLHPRHR